MGFGDRSLSYPCRSVPDQGRPMYGCVGPANCRESVSCRKITKDGPVQWSTSYRHGLSLNKKWSNGHRHGLRSDQLHILHHAKRKKAECIPMLPIAGFAVYHLYRFSAGRYIILLYTRLLRQPIFENLTTWVIFSAKRL